MVLIDGHVWLLVFHRALAYTPLPTIGFCVFSFSQVPDRRLVCCYVLHGGPSMILLMVGEAHGNEITARFCPSYLRL